jgi:hypothetical protein
MMKKYALVNVGLMLSVLFTMLVQSLHSFEHLHQVFDEKECHHKYTGNTELSHQHHPFDHCNVCEFTLGAFVAPSHFVYNTLEKPALPLYSSHYSNDLISFFKGSLFVLRGPPQL